MEIEHSTLVFLAKSAGLIYLIILSLAVLVYALWPSNKKTFDSAASSILTEEDRPCQ